MRVLIYLAALLSVIGCAAANQEAVQANVGALGLTADQVIPQLAQVSPVSAQLVPTASRNGFSLNSITPGQPFIVQFAESGCTTCQQDASVYAGSGVPVAVVLGDIGVLNQNLLGRFDGIVGGSRTMGLFTDTQNAAVNLALTKKQKSIWANHLAVACNRAGTCRLFSPNATNAIAQFGVPAENATAQEVLNFVNN